MPTESDPGSQPSDASPDASPEASLAGAEAIARELRQIRRMLAMMPVAVPSADPRIPALTHQQVTALDALQQRPLSLKELGGYLAITHSSVTGLVKRLASHGYVQRGTDPKDKRVTRVALTPNGQTRLSQTLPAQRLGVLLAVCMEVSPEDCKRILDGLRLLRQCLEAQLYPSPSSLPESPANGAPPTDPPVAPTAAPPDEHPDDSTGGTEGRDAAGS